MNALGRAIGIVVVLGLFTFALGAWLGWFDIDTRHEEKGRDEYGVEVRVDKEKIRDDLRRTGERVENLVPTEVAGTVVEVDSTLRIVKIQPEGTADVVAIEADDATSFGFEGQPETDPDSQTIGLDDIRPGTRIEATYWTKDNRKVAKKIELGTPEPPRRVD